MCDSHGLPSVLPDNASAHDNDHIASALRAREGF